MPQLPLYRVAAGALLGCRIMSQDTSIFSSRRLLTLLCHSIPYYSRCWHDIGDEHGVFGSTHPSQYNMDGMQTSSPVIEYVIHPHANILCVCAAYLSLYEQHYLQDRAQKERMQESFGKGVSWMCATHTTGSVQVDSFLSRKQWGGNWRSSLWSALLAMAAFFGRRFLTDAQLESVRRVVASEADRFTGVMPPTGCEYDTKCEENAQDTLLLAWAVALMPAHSHAQRWHASLSRWCCNIATSVFDKANHTRMGDSSWSRMVRTCTLFPDMTAENHGFFFPGVLGYTMWVTLAMAAFKCTSKQMPSGMYAASHQKTFDILLKFCLPNAELYTPGGNDLPLQYPSPLLLAWGLWHNDPRAYAMTDRQLSRLEYRMRDPAYETQRWVPGLPATGEGWELLFQSQVGFELAMLSLLPFQQHTRGASPGYVDGAINTRTNYGFVEVCYARNTRLSRSMAWKAIGAHPLVGINVHSFPELMVNRHAAGLSIPMTQPKIDTWKVLFHNDSYRPDGFDSYGLIEYYDSRRVPLIRRQLRVFTWSDEGLIVCDRCIASSEIAFEPQHLCGLHMANDIRTGGKLTLRSGSLKETFRADATGTRAVECPSFWASVEECVIFQFVWGRQKGLCYAPAQGRNFPPYWRNCRVDTLAVRIDAATPQPGQVIYELGYFVGTGKTPRNFKSSGTAGDFFKGLVIMDGKHTIGLA